MSLELNVNGKQVRVDVEPDTPLLWVLRDELKLTGTKFGCGQALCGACTVHADGSPIRSCQTSAADAANMKIVTIEGPQGRPPMRCAPRGESSTCHNAAIASRARSCRRPRF